MNRLFFLTVFMMLALTVRATIVTIQAPEGYDLNSVYVDNEYVDGTYEETTQHFIYSIDLEPGEHIVKASLSSIHDNKLLSTGKQQTFMVGDTPSTVIYSIDNFTRLIFSVKDESGKALKQANIDLYNELGSTKYCVTNEEGLAEVYVAADFGQNCTYTVSASNYAKLSGSFTLSKATNTIEISYEKYHKLTVSVKGTSAIYNGTVAVMNRDYNSTSANIYLSDNISSEDDSEIYFIVPDGEYCCFVETRYGQETENVASAFLFQKIDGQAVMVEADMSKCQPIELTKQGEKVSFYVTPIFNDTIVGYIGTSNITHLYPGNYQIYASFSDDWFQTSGSYYNQSLRVSDSPVSLSVPVSDFHHVNFALTGDYDNVGYTARINHWGNNIASASSIKFDDEFPNLYCGNFDYTLDVLWLDGWSYALPYAKQGRFSIKDADVTIPVDLSGVRLFKLDVSVGIDNIFITNERGEKARVGFLVKSMGLALPVGKYSIEGVVDDKKVSCILEVPENCPNWITLDFKDTQVGIESTSVSDEFSAQVTDDGLQIATSKYATVKVELFDMSGRCVDVINSVHDGQIVSTKNLIGGIYVARLSSDSVTRTVKFVVR